MAKKSLKRKAPSERKKYCHCTPFCNKKLTQRVRRNHYKRLSSEQLGAAQDSATATVSDYSSYSGENLSSDSDALQALEAQTLACSNSAKGSSSEESKHEISYDGSGGEDEERELLVDGGNERGSSYTRPDEDGLGEVSRVVQEDNDGDESEAGSGEPEGEGLEDDFWSDQGTEFDEWRDYHEDDEAAALQSDEERLQEFEDILGPEETAELWESRLCFTF
jgi:hypothetical protein